MCAAAGASLIESHIFYRCTQHSIIAGLAKKKMKKCKCMNCSELPAANALIIFKTDDDINSIFNCMNESRGYFIYYIY